MSNDLEVDVLTLMEKRLVACDQCKKWYHAECVDGCLNDLKQNVWFFFQIVLACKEFLFVYTCIVGVRCNYYACLHLMSYNVLYIL